MKPFVQTFFFLFFLTGYAQSETFVIAWKQKKTITVGESKIQIPFFTDGFSYEPETGLKFSRLLTRQWVDKNTIQLTHINLKTISESELGNLDIESIPSKIEFNLSNTEARGKRATHIVLKPIFFDRGVLKRIESFTVNYEVDFNYRSKKTSKNQITDAVLSNGKWYKFFVNESGVYKLTKRFLQSLGVETDQTPPQTIKIYGNGGAMLPYNNAEEYPLDIQEIAIQIIGEEDGTFDDEDYILFFAEGVSGYNEESDTHRNLYTDRACYFLNISPGNGKRISPMIEPMETANLILDSFQDYQYHEKDEYNLARMGRRWFGDRFDIEPKKTFSFNFPHINTDDPIKIKVFAAAVADVPTQMKVSVNGNDIGTMTFNKITEYKVLASQKSITKTIYIDSPNIEVTLDYNNGSNPSSLGFLDYISIEATRSLVYESDQMTFKNPQTLQGDGVVAYRLTQMEKASLVWDISDKYNVKSLPNPNGENLYTFKDRLNPVAKTYLIADPSSYLEPEIGNETFIVNQNIKGNIFLNEQGEFEDIDYLIVTPEIFRSQAERLAQINRSKYNLTVKVESTERIYNEFSSGNQDIAAIRNLVKYIYDNASNPEKRIKYLCLFGDSSYDYKERIENNTNYVPSWHSLNSFSLLSTFISDDFFGMMDEQEGNMETSDRLDIAVGRILADSPQRAIEMVDKIEHYHSEESFGSWRNDLVFVSDDADVISDAEIERVTNEMADELSEKKPTFNVMKIHADAYEQESTAGGDRYPEVKRALLSTIENGVLLVNYMGHGGENYLAAERILGKVEIDNLRNMDKLTCFITVTCEFTKFDDPQLETAGEHIYWNPNGGAISLVTTTRQIFINVAHSFNKALLKHLFSYNVEENLSIAEALRLSKNEISLASKAQRRLIFYIGDPALKLKKPQPEILLTKINDIPIKENTEPLKALSKVKLEGVVTDLNKATLTDYRGLLSVVIYDKRIKKRTLDNDGSGYIMGFETLGETIFKGKASIKNGTFTVTFVIPKDIKIPIGKGKVSFYAQKDFFTADNSGVNLDVEIGGLNENAPKDHKGPIISLYINDRSFVSGGITHENPMLIAYLEDENGINTASGIGHDIVAVIDNDEANPFVLNNFYETEVDSYVAGEINYAFRNLKPGLHTLSLKAWDVYNNSSTAEIQFVVHDKDEVLKIENVLNYPNPFVSYTEFWFNHNSFDPLNISIQIYTITGKLVKTLTGQSNGDHCCHQENSTLFRGLAWDGRDDFGDPLAKGVYVYRLSVKSQTLGKTVEKTEKLVKL